MIKFRIKNFLSEEEMQQVNILLVYDESGNEYSLVADQKGRLILTAQDNNLILEPSASNQILISTKK